MAEQHVESAHQLSGFQASQGFRFLQQVAPIEVVAGVIAQAIAGMSLIEALQRSPSPLALTTPARRWPA
jgi:hypothetical protein